MLHGFDVSAYQGNIVPTADFVIVKATEGSSYSSSKFAAQWKSAKTRAKVRGAYHFARPEESSGSSQADRLLAAAKAAPGELLVLDLEASKLNQAATNKWAREFGDRLRARAPGVTTVVYMGSGYASNGTGKGLNQHFTWWWYPQYPSSAATTKWPSSVSPWLPGGITTGWTRPHIWQWTSSFNGLDANITNLTLEQLAGGGQPTPMEADMLTGNFSAGKGEKPPIPFKPGVFTHIRLAWDNTRDNPALGITRQGPAHIRLAMHQPGRKGVNAEDLVVGAALTDTKGRPDAVEVSLPTGCDYIAVERNDDGTRPVGFCVY